MTVVAEIRSRPLFGRVKDLAGVLGKVLDGVVDRLHHGDRVTLKDHGVQQPRRRKPGKDFDRLAHGLLEPRRQLFAREPASRRELGLTIAHVEQTAGPVPDPLPHVTA